MESGSGWSRVIWIYNHIERKTHFTSKNTRNLGRVGTTRIFIEKHKELAGVGQPWHKLTVKMKPRRNLYSIHNDFSGVGGGLRRVYINKEQRWGWWHSLHLHSCEMLRNWWGLKQILHHGNAAIRLFHKLQIYRARQCFWSHTQNTWKNKGSLKHILHHGHAANAKKQLSVSLCHFPQASNLLRLPVFLKPHAKYVEKHRIFETNLTSLTSTKISKCLFYHSKMQFLHSEWCLLWHQWKCDRADEKKMIRPGARFCYKEQHPKICVSLQRKPHFSWYCPCWHTSVPENLDTVPNLYN